MLWLMPPSQRKFQQNAGRMPPLHDRLCRACRLCYAICYRCAVNGATVFFDRNLDNSLTYRVIGQANRTLESSLPVRLGPVAQV